MKQQEIEFTKEIVEELNKISEKRARLHAQLRSGVDCREDCLRANEANIVLIEVLQRCIKYFIGYTIEIREKRDKIQIGTENIYFEYNQYYAKEA